VIALVGLVGVWYLGYLDHRLPESIRSIRIKTLLGG